MHVHANFRWCVHCDADSIVCWPFRSQSRRYGWRSRLEGDHQSDEGRVHQHLGERQEGGSENRCHMFEHIEHKSGATSCDQEWGRSLVRCRSTDQREEVRFPSMHSNMFNCASMCVRTHSGACVHKRDYVGMCGILLCIVLRITWQASYIGRFSWL